MRAAWFGTESCSVLAKRFAIAEITLRKFWAEERAAGRLPPHPAARPHFGQIVTPNDDDDPFDAPERNEHASAALLAALQREHGDDPVMRFQDMPRHVLQMEANGYPPSEQRLRAFAHTKDIYTRALRARREAREAVCRA